MYTFLRLARLSPRARLSPWPRWRSRRPATGTAPPGPGTRLGARWQQPEPLHPGCSRPQDTPAVVRESRRDDFSLSPSVAGLGGGKGRG
eukprot:8848538-Pyramimonas_sp.AAC.1